MSLKRDTSMCPGCSCCWLVERRNGGVNYRLPQIRVAMRAALVVMGYSEGFREILTAAVSGIR